MELSISLAVIATACCVACIAVVSFSLYQHISKSSNYAAFLSHHKSSGACTARFMKLMLSQSFQGQIFYDCDNLSSFAAIFDCVKESNMLVVIMSGCTLCRPWCVGEIVTADRCGVPIQTIMCSSGKSKPCDYRDSWTHLTEKEMLRVLGSFEQLRPYGIACEDIVPVLNRVAEMPCLRIDLADSADIKAAVKTLLSRNIRNNQAELIKETEETSMSRTLSTGSTDTAWGVGSTDTALFSSSASNRGGQACILLLSDHADVEATASARIVKIYMQKLLQMTVDLSVAMPVDIFARKVYDSSYRVVMFQVSDQTLKCTQQIAQYAFVHQVMPTTPVYIVHIGASFIPLENDYLDTLRATGEPFADGDGTACAESNFASEVGVKGIGVDVVEAALRYAYGTNIATILNISHAEEKILERSVHTLGNTVQQAVAKSSVAQRPSRKSSADNHHSGRVHPAPPSDPHPLAWPGG
jgi:hypothetical protein